MTSATDRPGGEPGAGHSLLIAVTGGPGTGKTRLLAELAAWHSSGGGRTDGFVAMAGHRVDPTAGADEYRLHLVATGEEWPWLVRDENTDPPYAVSEPTKARLAAWAGSLETASRLVVLDEFSRFEARGEGLMEFWPAIAKAQPQILVIAVRSGLEAAIEQRLGRAFDLRVGAVAPDALEQLQTASADYGEWTRIGLFGGSAGGLETTVGSALHAANVPFRGLAMASLQAALMTFTGFGLTRPGRVIWVPFISAGLKALSPAGSRLRPMLAISVQGALFGLSVQLIGWNAAGATIGGALVGAWSSLQGLALQYLMMGDEMAKAYDTAIVWLAGRWGIAPPGLPWLIAAWALVQAAFAAAVTLIAWRRRAAPESLQRLIDRERDHAKASARDAARRTLRLGDLTRWQFWLPLLTVGGILASAGRSTEALAWLAVRFLAVSMVLGALVSMVRPARWAERLRRLGWWGPALAMSSAIGRQRTRAED